MAQRYKLFIIGNKIEYSFCGEMTLQSYISSRKRSVFKEEILLQRGNVPKTTTKPGENAAQGRNIHEKVPKHGGNAPQEKNIHEMTSERGENALQEKNVH